MFLFPCREHEERNSPCNPGDLFHNFLVNIKEYPKIIFPVIFLHRPNVQLAVFEGLPQPVMHGAEQIGLFGHICDRIGYVFSEMSTLFGLKLNHVFTFLHIFLFLCMDHFCSK